MAFQLRGSFADQLVFLDLVGIHQSHRALRRAFARLQGGDLQDIVLGPLMSSRSTVFPLATPVTRLRFQSKLSSMGRSFSSVPRKFGWHHVTVDDAKGGRLQEIGPAMQFETGRAAR
jgi:hypothetical protein